MVLISKDHVVYQLSGSNSPVSEINSNEQVIFETFDCFTNQITSEQDKFTNIGWEQINPATGPIYIKDAKPGDVLKITIEDILVGDHGVMVTAPNFGVIGDEISQETTKIIPIQNNKAIVSENLQIPIKPMIGVIGTAPSGVDPIPCGTPGEHGGNMDCKEIVTGSTLYLPVAHNGALLALGDLHAVMADGEVSMTGLEINGKVTLNTEVIPKNNLESSANWPTPMIDNGTDLIFVHSEKTLDSSVKGVTSKACGFLANKANISMEEAVSLLSLFGELKICQVVDPLMTVRMELSWKYLKKLGIENI